MRATLPAMMNLKEVVDRYVSLAGWGTPLALSRFGLPPQETARLFSALDEDYHISRFLHFSRGGGESYEIGGESATHVAIEPGISSLL